MCKKLLSTIFFAGILTLTSFISAFANPLDYKIAELNNVKCLINGREVYIDAYNIEGNNFFRARDICKELDYSVKWDNVVKSVWIRTNEPYIPDEEKEVAFVKNVSVEVKKQWIYVNDSTDEVSACSIGGYNYFMLRDLQRLTELSIPFTSNEKYFEVAWDKDSSSIIINNMIADKKDDTFLPQDNEPLSPTITENNSITIKETTYTSEEFQEEVLRLVNVEREKVGVAPLEADPLLMEIAMLKAKEMVEQGYYSHESPTYGRPTEFAKQYGYNRDVAENIHAGFDFENPQDVVNSWINSEGHRKNMMNENHKYMGFGYSIDNENQMLNYNSNTYFSSMYCVQMFSK